MSLDYYEIIGVENNASPEQIKKAYRSRARQLHPDLNDSADAKQQFQLLVEAYSVLKDPKRRAFYDEGNIEAATQVEQPKWEEIFDENAKHARRSTRTHGEYYYQTNYEANKKTATAFCFVMLLFSLSYVADLFLNEQLGQTQIEKIIYNNDPRATTQERERVQIETDVQNFELPIKREDFSLGEDLELRKSKIYGFISYKRRSQETFQYSYAAHSLIYVGCLIALISAGLGVAPWTKAERKFNAAIISTFFSLGMLSLTLLA